MIDGGSDYTFNIPPKADFNQLKKIYDDLTEKNESVAEAVRRKIAMRERKITQVNFDNETKEMVIRYHDGTSKVFSDVEITDVCEQHRIDSSMAEVVYNFKKSTDDFGKYVEDFGGKNG